MARKKPTEEPQSGRAALPRGLDDRQVVPTKSGKPSALLNDLREIQRCFVEEHAIIVPLTVQEILEEQIGMKLV